jgi:hypothetical protein
VDVLGDLEDLGVLRVVEVREPEKKGGKPSVVVDLTRRGRALVELLAVETAYILLLRKDPDFLEDLGRGLPVKSAAALVTMGFLRLLLFLKWAAGIIQAERFSDDYIESLSTFFHSMLESEGDLYASIRQNVLLLASMFKEEEGGTRAG